MTMPRLVDSTTYARIGELIVAAGRCRFLHTWGPWESYQRQRPVRVLVPPVPHVATVSEFRRRRQCSRCGRTDDRLVRVG